MRIKLKYPNVETFIQKYAMNISRGGIFIATKSPKPVGTLLKFEFLLANAAGTSLIRGEGQVQWTREYDPSQPQKAHGMGVKFTKLDEGSQAVVDRALKWRAEHGRRPSDSESFNVSHVGPGADSARVVTAPTLVATPVPLPPEPTVPTALEREDTTMLDAPEVPAAPQEVAVPVPAPQVAVSAPPPQVTVPTPPPEVAAAGLSQDRSPDEPTREVPIPDAPASPRRDLETRPIELRDDEPPPAAEAPLPRPITPDDSVRIALGRHRLRNGRGRSASEIDQLMRDWGLSEERVRATLKRKRPRLVEATAELERLLLRPSRAPAPTRAEAVQRLGALLARRPVPVDGLAPPPPSAQAQAAGGEPEPQAPTHAHARGR